jgi:hypothetical protein
MFGQVDFTKILYSTLKRQFNKTHMAQILKSCGTNKILGAKINLVAVIGAAVGLMSIYGQTGAAAIPESARKWFQTETSLQLGKVREFTGISGFEFLAGKKVERVSLQLSHPDFSKLSGQVNFVHFEKRSSPDRLIVSFSRTITCRFTEPQFLQKLRQSRHIKSAQIEFDSLTQSMRFVFSLQPGLAFKVEEAKTKDQIPVVHIDFAKLNTKKM